MTKALRHPAEGEPRAAAAIAVVEVTGGENLEAVRRLVREYQEEFLGEAAFQRYLTEQHFEEELSTLPGKYAPPRGALMLALHTGHPAGCVALKDLGGGTCEMKRLFVKPGYRGLKLGGMLVDSIVRKGRELGYSKMRLDTLPSMAEARGLYRSFGFREIPPYCESPVSDAAYFELSL